jgi:hypothetical protein
MRRWRRGRDSESCLAISCISKGVCSVAQAKSLPSLIYHELVLEVRFIAWGSGHDENFDHTGNLFCTDSGKPLSPRNILRDSLHPTLAKLKQTKMGFHCFRRFRESVLQKSEARALLVDYWMGHENREMGTRYAKQLVEDVAWRKQWARKVGLGFKLTDLQLEIGQLGQLSASKTQPAKAA